MDFHYTHEGTYCTLTPMSLRAKQYSLLEFPLDANVLGLSYLFTPKEVAEILEEIEHHDMRGNWL